jgi:hypothetical protein
MMVKGRAAAALGAAVCAAAGAVGAAESAEGPEQLLVGVGRCAMVLPTAAWNNEVCVLCKVVNGRRTAWCWRARQQDRISGPAALAAITNWCQSHSSTEYLPVDHLTEHIDAEMWLVSGH